MIKHGHVYGMSNNFEFNENAQVPAFLLSLGELAGLSSLLQNMSSKKGGA